MHGSRPKRKRSDELIPPFPATYRRIPWISQRYNYPILGFFNAKLARPAPWSSRNHSRRRLWPANSEGWLRTDRTRCTSAPASGATLRPGPASTAARQSAVHVTAAKPRLQASASYGCEALLALHPACARHAAHRHHRPDEYPWLHEGRAPGDV